MMVSVGVLEQALHRPDQRVANPLHGARVAQRLRNMPVVNTSSRTICSALARPSLVRSMPQ